MANALGAFYDLPPWVEEMQRMQRKLEAITKPLLAVQDDTWLAAKNMAAAFESPVMRELELMARQCTPGLMKAVQQEQELLAKLNPLADIYTEIVGQIPDWSRDVFDTTPFRCDELLLARNHALLQWAEVADRVANIAEPDIAEPDIMDDLSEEDQQVITAEIAEVFAENENWDQRFMASMVKFGDSHPTLAWLFKKVFLKILIDLIVGLLCTAIGQALFPAKVYEEPTTSSKVVYHVEQHQTVIVIGDERYYYEVEVRPEGSTGVKRGYMSKRSVLIHEPNQDFVEIAMDE